MPAAPKQRKQNRHDPLTTSSSAGQGSSSSATAGPSKIKGPKPLESRDGSGIPGISKLKSQIRQTKRFLAKDNLEPGLRISTQRRLTSLEADLARAEQRDVAKKNGGKYHMIKFFERQKLTRIIKRCKKKLNDDEKEVKASKKSGYEQDLLHARIMYNYILHYPNEQKYISLFPSDTSSKGETKSKLPTHLSSSIEPTEKSDKKRLEILRSIQDKMERGEVSSTPEEEGRGSKVHLNVEGSAAVGAKTKQVVAPKEEEDDFFEAE